ncbi:MAG: AbrB/MazE/SpoVT family DNA-binding domain-containing protein [Candidatus Omnitrophota bacterium]
MKTLNKGSYYVSHVTSKGQTTIPRAIRDILGLKEGSEIAFKPERGGIMLVRVTTTIQEADPYTSAEWDKIKDLSAEKGKSFKNAKALLKHLHKA